MPQTGALPRHPVRLADPVPRAVVTFDLRPDAAGCAAIADALEISAVRKLRLAGTLTPSGRRDWILEATLGATVVQPCVVTLAPVTTRIDEAFTRRYMTGLDDPAPGETEMPDDDVEPLPVILDLWETGVEALSLALPAWPRAEGVEPADITVAEPGVAPLDSDAARPFAGLAGLRDKLEGEGGESG